MGKYSLDAFERYPLVKLRPVTANPAESCYRLLELSQAELEPKGGELLPPPEMGEGAVILSLQLDGSRDLADTCGFVRRVGSFYAGGKGLCGVVLTAGKFAGASAAELLRAYRQGFELTTLLVEPGTELVDVCRREGIETGLCLPLAHGILNLRRSIAQSNLERTWRTAPVYLYAGRPLEPEEMDAACRWHSSGADCMAILGPCMTLRRLMFPKDLTSGGAFPLRMWWQNLGTAPLYHDVCVRIQLRNGAEQYDIPVPGTMRPGLGDTTFNVTARLPQAANATYSLWIGLEGKNGFLPLAVDAAEKDRGMVCMGEVTLDDVCRPYLDTMWEEQYADGYYPLEDPAQPE